MAELIQQQQAASRTLAGIDTPVKSVVELDINVPQERLAALFADPRNSTEWMDDLARYEPLSGVPGTPGSTYRLVPKTGKMIFVATVIATRLPTEVCLHLDAASVAVSVTATFTALTPESTHLVSEEVFSFKGLIHTLFGFVAQWAIRRAHRRHMTGFKRFAEQRE
jgi:hypothetical protein